MNVFILTAVRSGSTYLMHMLRDTGLFHYPELHDPHPSLILQHEIQEFFADNEHIDPWVINQEKKTKAACIKYLEYKLKFMHKEPCLFKVLKKQYYYYLLENSDRSLIESMIPGLKYIWLERSDFIARAVSEYFFIKSKIDHLYDYKSYSDYMSTNIHIELYDIIDIYKKETERCDWSEFLGEKEYIKIEYEDLIKNPIIALTRCLDHLGLDYSNIDLQKIVDKQPKFKTQRPESKYWMELLRRELKKWTI